MSSAAVLRAVMNTCMRAQEVLKSCDTLLQESARSGQKLRYTHAGECCVASSSLQACDLLSNLKCSKAVINSCRRMQEVRSSEQRATVEDLMYASVLEKFMNLKVEMMPR